MKFIQTLGYVEDAHTHIDRFVEFHLEFMHFCATRFSEKTLRL